MEIIQKAEALAIDPMPAKKKKRKKKTFQDKYELTNTILGEGAFAVVKECIKLADRSRCAVKILNKTSVNRDHVMLEYGILLQAAQHPNVVHLFDFFEEPDYFRFVFEKLQGGEVLDFIAKAGAFTELQASQVICQIAGALDFLHYEGIAHRDLKPQNILCAESDSVVPVKLCDFNLAAKRAKSNTKKQSPLFAPVGTPEFMSPEVAEAISFGESWRFDKSCDVWSLGVVMYILLCGYPPFTGDCGSNCGWRDGKPCPRCSELLLDSIQDGFFEFPKTEWKRVSGAAKDLISRMLVRADDRLVISDVLRHPWLTQSPPNTNLCTPDMLSKSSLHESHIDSFAAQANMSQRSIQSRDGMGIASRLSSVQGIPIPRSRAVSFKPFQDVELAELDEICTPRIGLVHNNHDALSTPIIMSPISTPGILSPDRPTQVEEFESF